MLYLILSSEIEVIDIEKGEFSYFPLLKIGYTKDIDSRFDTYLLHNPGCKLLGKREGDTELESFFHSYYSKYKYPNRGEWFYYSQEIIDNFQTLEVGDKYLTKEEYIEGLREFLKNNVSTPKELREKYLDSLLKELENTGSKVGFDRDLHISFTMILWREGYEREMEYIDSYNFHELLKDFPERINLRENPWKNSAEFYYRATADYRKMSWKDFEKIIKDKEEATENLLKAYNESSSDSIKSTLSKTYQNNAKAYNYGNDYVAVNKYRASTGNIELVPVENELVKVNELRAFRIQQIDYKDRFTVFTTISNTLTPDDITNQEVSSFMKIYDSYKTRYEKLKLLCEYSLSQSAIKIILGQISDSDEIKSYYLALGPQRLKNLGYDVTRIKRELGIVTFSPELLREEIYSNFKEGEKYILSDLKNKLSFLYNSINYKSNPKANDIKNWFDIREISIYEKREDGGRRRIRAYELLKSKRNLLEERFVD